MADLYTLWGPTIGEQRADRQAGVASRVPVTDLPSNVHFVVSQMRDAFKRKGARFEGIRRTRSGWREAFSWGGRWFAWEVVGRRQTWTLIMRVELPVAGVEQEIRGLIVRDGKLLTPPKVGPWFQQVREAVKAEDAGAVVK